jgi:hypothetical protein
VADEDHASNPGTAPFVPDFDTGEDSVPFVPNFDDTDSHSFAPLQTKPEKSRKFRWRKSERDKSEPAEPSETKSEIKAEPESPSPAAEEDSAAAPAQSVTVPGRYQYLKWWKLVLVILGVWLAAVEVGLSLFYWWYHTIDKTAPMFMVLVYVVACSVAAVMLAMVRGRPLISALAIGVLTGPFASAVAAAPLYGYYYCERVGHCLAGVIPY